MKSAPQAISAAYANPKPCATFTASEPHAFAAHVRPLTDRLWKEMPALGYPTLS